MKYSNDTGIIKVKFGAMFFAVISLILLALFIFGFSRKLSGGDVVSFSSFLNWLGSVDSFSINVSISDFMIYSSWGAFNFLRDFLNIFAGMFGVIVYLCSNLINLIIFAGQFLRFLFV